MDEIGCQCETCSSVNAIKAQIRAAVTIDDDGFKLYCACLEIAARLSVEKGQGIVGFAAVTQEMYVRAGGSRAIDIGHLGYPKEALN